MRIALGIEYDGSQFHGWQSQQPGVRTVQSTLQAAIARIADHPVSLACAGRTDAGVHASAQVVHFDARAARPSRAWVQGCNSHLPPDISVSWAREVPAAFHARFSALSRRYRYAILNRATRSALLRTQTTWWRQPLDTPRMHDAGQSLVGEHDFSSFRAAECQSRSAQRRLTELCVTRHGEHVIVEVEANAFLHHMVRNLVGVLLEVGSGEQAPVWVAQVLAARDRTQAGITAPPEGLCLVAVRYPAEFHLPD